MKTYILAVLILFSSKCFSQEEIIENMTIIKGITEDKVYETTLERLIKSSYFITHSDKSSKILQCKYILKNKGWFAGKSGDIIHYNILFKNTDNGDTLVYIQANKTKKSKSGSVEVSDYYNDDLGIVTDKKVIDPIFQFIKNGF